MTLAARSQFHLTVDALARSNGPYDVDGGAQLTFEGGPDKPDTTYAWEFGDGESVAGRIVTHAYADNGVYVAKLTTSVSQPGGVVTEHLAEVRVHNVDPVVGPAAPVSCDEGEEIELSISFRDQEWADTHTALFFFGDNSLPEPGTVSETHEPPAAQGTATARHAWCDSGHFTVTVLVRDDDGGMAEGQIEVEVRNLAPTVDAGPDRYAYVCAPMPLVAAFTDPGWCDTHTATWEPGDCTPAHPAIVRERHDPPRGEGVAVLLHRYERCGSYLARCVVADDDGGVGEDWAMIQVVDVRNPGFEDGFRQLTRGAVANEWEPYPHDPEDERARLAGAALAPGGGTAPYAAEELRVRSGQRSQRVTFTGDALGLRQSVGANPGWDYQVAAWYHLDERGAGRCRLGLDPAGGTDPAAAAVEWAAGTERHRWAQLAARVTAKGPAITIFLEVAGLQAEGGDGPAVAWFDEVALVPTPCPLDELEPPRPQPERDAVCVSFAKDKRQALKSRFERDGFVFRSLDGSPLRITSAGAPQGEGKLQLGVTGIRVDLPFTASRIRARVVQTARFPITLTGFDTAQRIVGKVTGAPTSGAVDDIELRDRALAAVEIAGGLGEGLLLEVCAWPAPEKRTRPKLDKGRRPEENPSAGKRAPVR